MNVDYLRNNIQDIHIRMILENIKCHEIREHSKYFTCANPDGDNPNAIVVYKDTLYAENYTRKKFNNYKFKDIVSLIEMICDLNYFEAINKICSICDFEYYEQQKEANELTNFLRFIELGSRKHEEEIQIEIFPETILSQYYKNPNQKWVNEGIDVYSQNNFEIGFDIYMERITIPIRDEVGRLVGIKGRLLNDDQNEDKYIYIYKCPKSHILYGLWQNYQNIKNENMVIIVEAEKSVIKLYAHGYKNVIAIGGSSISKYQIEKIMRLGIDNIVIAMDKDIKLNEIKSICKKLDIGIKLHNIEYLYDDINFLKDKESPCDNINNFRVLMNNFRYSFV